jgi:hypothetical protein
MKLKELLTEIFGETPKIDNQSFPPFGFDGLSLYGRDGLEPYKERILQCEEFSDCTELNFMNLPMLLSDDDLPIKAESIKLVEGQKFKGVCYLLSLALTPEVFDPETLHIPVKDGACITPTVYNPETFKPFKKIVLEYSPERAMDGLVTGEDDVKSELRDLLDKVLDNPYDYQVKGDRGVIVRGVFERNEIVKEVTPPRYLTGVKSFVKEEEMPGLAYYLEANEKNEGEVEMKIKNVLIPPHLKQLFKETLGDKNLQLTKEDIDKFLEENS